MTRSARFTKAELANAIRLSKEHSVTVKLDRDGSIIVFPVPPLPAILDKSPTDELDAELAAFEAKHGGD